MVENGIIEMTQRDIHADGVKSPTGKGLTSRERASQGKPLFDAWLRPVGPLHIILFRYIPFKTVRKTMHHNHSPVIALNQ